MSAGAAGGAAVTGAKQNTVTANEPNNRVMCRLDFRITTGLWTLARFVPNTIFSQIKSGYTALKRILGTA